MTKQQVLEFIMEHKHTVISTCGNNGQPECAVIGFGQTENFELIFGTFKTSRKYKNIQENNKVAFVIGWDEDYKTVQYEGIAEELHGEDIEKYVVEYFSKVPGAAAYRHKPNQAYFKVTPTWLRYSDLSEEDNEHVVEFTF